MTPPFSIEIEPLLQQKCPELRLGNILCSVQVNSNYPLLLDNIQTISNAIAARTTTNQISQLANIAATRQAYKALGKKPGRYRPSAEALLRRVVSGKGLYTVNNIVDLLNLVSISTGFSIGGYDFETIQGAIQLGIGRPNEPYQAIGRGDLNIANLPIFRDKIGAFGTPTSDAVRTMVQPQTHLFWMVLYAFDGNTVSLEAAMQQAQNLLTNFAEASDFQTWIC